MSTDTLTDNELIDNFYASQGGKPVAVKADLDFYESDWSMLMPVVEKIAQHVYESYPDHNGYKEVVAHDRAYPRTFGMIDSDGRWMVRINRMPLEQEDSLIKATYKAVIEFIKWYNQQPK